MNLNVRDSIKGRWDSVADAAILAEHRAQLWKRRNFHRGRVVRDSRVRHDGRWWSSPELKAYPGSRVFLLRGGLELVREGSELLWRLPLLNEDLTFIGFVYEQRPQ